MPSLSQIARDYALPVLAPVAGGLINRRAAGSATNRLTTGAREAMDTINTGADRARRTLADVYGEQKDVLDPYRKAAEGPLGDLSTGVAAGGEFNKPFTMADFELYKDPGFQVRVAQGERAIKAGANAGGIRFSGATLKALGNYNQESASQEAVNAFNRQQSDLSGRFNRVSSVVDRGFDAANQTVNAGGTYGANLANLETGTARSIADLQTDLASAEAAGDVAKASTITDTINSILSGVENVGTAKLLERITGGGGSSATNLQKLATEYGPAAGAAVGTGASLTGGVLAPTAAELAATLGTVSSVAGTAGGAGGATTSVIGSTTAGGGGAPAAIGAFLTNPITIAAAAAIGVGVLWAKSQAHHEASEWTSKFQDKFDATMARINEDPQLAPEHKAELQRAQVIDYLAAAMEFAKKKGSDGRKVVGQSMREFKRWYPAYSSMAVA